MPINAHGLTIWDTLYPDLNVAVDDSRKTRIEGMVNAVSEAIEQIAQRHFEFQVGIVEFVKGHGTYEIVLDRTPVRSIQSIAFISVDGTVSETYDSTSYSFDPTTGIVHRSGGWAWSAEAADDIRGSPLGGSERRALRVIYTGGYVTPEQARIGGYGARDLPADLEEAALISATALFKRRGANRDIQNDATQQSSVTYRSPAEGNILIGTEGTGLLTLEAAQVARKYRRVA